MTLHGVFPVLADTAVFILVAVLILAGLAGSVIPFIPGPLLVLAGVFCYAWYTEFVVVTWSLLFVLAILALGSQVLDTIASLIGAKKYGAGRWGMLGAFLGGIAGFFAGGVVGIVLGPFFGAVAGEVIAGRNFNAALRSGTGSFIGILGGTLGRIIISCIMVGVFVLSII